MKRPLQAQIDQSLSVPIVWEGQAHVLDLQVPSAESLSWSVPMPGVAPARRWNDERRLRFFRDISASIDGKPFLAVSREQLAKDDQVFAAALRGRNAAYEALRTGGRWFTTCPACGREDERDLQVLVIGLNARLPPFIADDGVFLATPQLADPWPAGKRPSGVLLAARLRFVLPSAEYRFASSHTETYVGGVLGNVHRVSYAPDDPELAAWEKYENKQSGWIAAIPGFRASLRLSVALESLGERSDIGPELVEGLSLVDFAFLDALYWLTHNVDVGSDSTLLQPCPDCKTAYLPVR